ncbi:undecaprenyl-diphosphate phosphatase [Nocardioides anomalus]|uniref:Undecaprenyl-diphosphatase n=1 Tax=Nocardioides anomalus TaxID=2712223 RepID=A0A6G6WF32_9ACTN|nr:undecaprenyl-diphosphate phosphatase [Nocardioides anomalus]
MTSIDTWQAVLLGTVEGLTEFLPVSSTAHLKLTESLLGLPVGDDAVVAYTALIQTGAIAAVLVYFVRDLATLTVAGLRGLVHAPTRSTEEFRLAWWIVLATIPLAAVGILAKPLIEGPLASLWVVAASLVLGSLYMAAADRRAARAPRRDDVGVRDALLIGSSQILALLLPGFSRSGASISTGLLLGLDRVRATRLSFLFSVPALTGAGLYELKDAAGAGAAGPLLLGIAVAFAVSLASIAWLLRFVARHSFSAFIGYRLALAVVVVVALAVGALAA